MKLCEKPEAVEDRSFSNSRIAEGGFEFGCSRHYKDIARLGMYLFRRERQIREEVGRLHSVRRGWPRFVKKRT